LARLLFLSRGSTLPVLTAGHLLDPDPRIHNYAIQLLLDQPEPGLTESNTIRTLICSAAKTILKNARGLELLGRFQLDEKAALLPEAKTEFDECWSTVITLAEGSRPGWPDLDTFAELLGGLERGGLDLVLAVDTTRSMEAGLRDLKKACSWLLPSLQWGASGVRVGFLTYKDKVVETHGLSETPGEDLLPHLLELKALGGGDVPEGVDSALRASLELGRFSWRPSAAKRIVVIGDAPPNYSELPAIESLVSSCHEQDGFIVHMIGVHPKEGGRVPFFDRIAARGGGRSPTCPTGDLGKELLLGSLRAEDTALPKDLAGLLRRAFSELP
ncbi:MAG: VWA domain-containing protein, partial [Planctomycetes bacterium]|nr:VWA domain-containing protein [Planctomycetota bacterium]